MTLHFVVYGIAQQMGSKRAFTPRGWDRPIITDSNRNLKGWQALVRDIASHTIEQRPPAERTLLEDGVRLTIAFYLPRPKSLPRKVTAHTKAPDVDKLVRALGDALTGVAFVDDRQVVDLIAMKRYAPPGGVPCVEVWVEATAGVVSLPRAQPLFDLAGVSA